MGNRAQRRAMAKSQNDRYKNMMASYTKQSLTEALIKNGITPEDLKAEYKRGYDDGARAAGLQIFKCCYAGIAIALADEFGFGEDECFRAICAADEKMIWALNNSELVDEVLEKTGLRLELDEPFERVQKVR